MKNLLLIILFIPILVFPQEYINIGSTKADVKKVQGEPTSIKNLEYINEEVWGYGKYGFATITFKNGKISSFRNDDNILKIGELNKKSKSKIEESLKGVNDYSSLGAGAGEKHTTGKDSNPYIERLREAGKDPNLLNEITEEDTANDYSGLGKNRSGRASIPEEYEEMGEARGLNPFNLPDEYRLKEMQSEYEREKYFKYILMTIGIFLVIFFFFRRNKKSKELK